MKEAAIPIVSGLRVFLCHASQDKRAVRELYERLRIDGFLPWFDKEDLLPGQNWREEFAKAVRASHFVIVCLSRKVNSAGYRQKEVRLALEVADEQPEGKIFLIPAKLEECEVPNGLSRWQWANLFEEDGYQQLQRALATGATAIGIDLLRPSGDASKSSAHYATRTGAVQRLLDLQILEVDDPEITKLLRMPEVLSDLVKRLVTSGGPRLQSMLSGVLSYCLADPSNSGKLLKIQARLVEQPLQNAPAIGTLNGTLPQVQWCLSSTDFSKHPDTSICCAKGMRQRAYCPSRLA